ncbi:hypothetical protein EAO75_14180 [Streptomyces sp. uw30]|uniref:hypothetical protein n=1 Tax=Streptomyces sp. uw30 TaxID=1828179 RepID=UPI0011CDBD27|nr:hypothetical protein [Streptomyces sp. uw30]TXS49834.1 hypothetical protein EAO75_14180 [Streptomyces sp. uw30]
MDEHVFLPVEGLRRRDAWPSGSEAFDSHRTAAVEEGARRRRHYLSIQIPGEAQDCVATVFVRVHTHGGMLMMEYLPHVLHPVRPVFRAADRIAASRAHFPAGVWWLRTPEFAARSVSQLLRHGASSWRAWSGNRWRESPDGPHVSVRGPRSRSVRAVRIRGDSNRIFARLPMGLPLAGPTYHGADLAADLLRRYEVPEPDIDRVWEAIALHTSPGIAERRGLLSYLTREGVGLDFGRNAEIARTWEKQIHAAYPRLDMVRSLVDAIVERAARSAAAAPRYSVGGELLLERQTNGVTRMELAAASSPWEG